MATNVCKKEVLTPPDSPRDEELITPPSSPKGVFIKLFDGTEQVMEWDKIKDETGPDCTDDSSILSEKSFGRDDDFSEDYTSSSPYLVLGISSDDDNSYYTPPPSQQKRSNVRITTEPKKKSYARQMQDDRKIRKKVSDARKQRKMEQNKIAATRYRQKKKQELERSKNEEGMLKEANRELRTQLEVVSREVACLKSLLRDAYCRRG